MPELLTIDEREFEGALSPRLTAFTSNATIELSSERFRTGSKSLKIRSTAGPNTFCGAVYTIQNADLTSASYNNYLYAEVRGWYLETNRKQNIAFYLRQYNASALNGVYEDSINQRETQAINVWQPFVAQARVRAPVGQVEVYILLTNASLNDVVFIDNMSCEFYNDPPVTRCWDGAAWKARTTYMWDGTKWA